MTGLGQENGPEGGGSVSSQTTAQVHLAGDKGNESKYASVKGNDASHRRRKCSFIESGAGASGGNISERLHVNNADAAARSGDAAKSTGSAGGNVVEDADSTARCSRSCAYHLVENHRERAQYSVF